MKLKNLIKKNIKYLLPNKIFHALKQKSIMNKYHDKFLKVGKNVDISNSKIGMKIYLGSNIKITNSSISDHTYIASNTRISNAHIGKYCSIAENVQINLGEHPINYVSTHPAFYSNNKEFETYADKLYYKEIHNVEIGNDVWIGYNSVVMGGVVISDGAIIASGAVVTKDVEPYSIVGGVPAKHIKYRFTKEEIKEILKIKWWNFNEEILRKNFKDFHNIEHFISKYKM